MNSGRIGKTWLIPLLVFSGLLIIGIGSAAAAGELTATRDISNQTVEAGDTFTVTVTITANQTVCAPVLDEDLPNGWIVTEVDNASAVFKNITTAVFKNTTTEWLWLENLSAGASKTVIYNVTVPSDAINRSYAITGNVSARNVTATAVGGKCAVTVGTVTLTAISVTPVTATVAIGGTQTFTATAYDQNDNQIVGVAITWTGWNTSVGTVSPASSTTGADGKATTTFTALTEGTTTVIAYNVPMGPSINGTATIMVSGTGVTGDITGEGDVNVLDMIRVGQHFGETGTDGWIPEDVKADGKIDVLDMILIGQNWTG